MRALIADRAYDGDDFRAEIIKRGAKPVIPNKANRVKFHRFDKRAYKAATSSSEPSVGSKISGELPRDMTNLPKLPAAVHIAALVAYWLN